MDTTKTIKKQGQITMEAMEITDVNGKIETRRKMHNTWNKRNYVWKHVLWK